MCITATIAAATAASVHVFRLQPQKHHIFERKSNAENILLSVPTPTGPQNCKANENFNSQNGFLFFIHILQLILVLQLFLVAGYEYACGCVCVHVCVCKQKQCIHTVSRYEAHAIEAACLDDIVVDDDNINNNDNSRNNSGNKEISINHFSFCLAFVVHPSRFPLFRTVAKSELVTSFLGSQPPSFFRISTTVDFPLVPFYYFIGNALVSFHILYIRMS